MVVRMRRDDWTDIVEGKTGNPLVEQVILGLLVEAKAGGMNVRVVDLDGSIIGRL
ncbi:MAG: hypothetical protein ABSF73_03185 [Terriglobia bacterium]|jgi:hypothetical protein